MTLRGICDEVAWPQSGGKIYEKKDSNIFLDIFVWSIEQYLT